MTDEHEIAGEKRARGRVEDGEVAIGMRRRPSAQFEDPSPQIERQAVRDGQGRRNDPDLVDKLVADDPAVRLEIECAAHRQGSRQVAVADERRPEPVEGRIAEDVIGMLMGIDHIEDGLRRARTNGSEQSLADRHAAAGVDDGYALVADHETNIGDVAQVLFAHERDLAHVHEHARRNFLNRQGRERLAAGTRIAGRMRERAITRAPSGKRILQPFLRRRA